MRRVLLTLVFATAAQAQPAPQQPTPGTLLTQARALLQTGDIDGAIRVTRGIISTWPTAARARLLLAQALESKGETDKAKVVLQWVVQQGAPPLAAIARSRLAGTSPGIDWGVRARTGAAYDSAVLPPGARDPTSTADGRAELGAAVTARRKGWDAALSLDRTLHLEARTADATILGVVNRLRLGQTANRLLLTADAQGIFAERRARPHHTLLGGGATWWRARTWSPFVQGSAHWAAYQTAADRSDAPHEARIAGATGLRWLGGRETVSLRFDGRWVGPDASTGFTDVSATLGGAVLLRRWRFGAYGGFGLRWTELGQERRPRVGADLGWTPVSGWTLRADVRWLGAQRDADSVDRLIAGLGLEVRR